MTTDYALSSPLRFTSNVNFNSNVTFKNIEPIFSNVTLSNIGGITFGEDATIAGGPLSWDADLVAGTSGLMVESGEIASMIVGTEMSFTAPSFQLNPSTKTIVSGDLIAGSNLSVNTLLVNTPSSNVTLSTTSGTLALPSTVTVTGTSMDVLSLTTSNITATTGVSVSSGNLSVTSSNVSTTTLTAPAIVMDSASTAAVVLDPSVVVTESSPAYMNGLEVTPVATTLTDSEFFKVVWVNMSDTAWTVNRPASMVADTRVERFVVNSHSAPLTVLGTTIPAGTTRTLIIHYDGSTFGATSIAANHSNMTGDISYNSTLSCSTMGVGSNLTVTNGLTVVGDYTGTGTMAAASMSSSNVDCSGITTVTGTTSTSGDHTSAKLVTPSLVRSIVEVSALVIPTTILGTSTRMVVTDAFPTIALPAMATLRDLMVDFTSVVVEVKNALTSGSVTITNSGDYTVHLAELVVPHLHTLSVRLHRHGSTVLIV